PALLFRLSNAMLARHHLGGDWDQWDGFAAQRNRRYARCTARCPFRARAVERRTTGPTIKTTSASAGGVFRPANQTFPSSFVRRGVGSAVVRRRRWGLWCRAPRPGVVHAALRPVVLRARSDTLATRLLARSAP